eukprot:SAG31_NODE_10034_length_1193_cov_0.850091_1_plen_232_part_01
MNALWYATKAREGDGNPEAAQEWPIHTKVIVGLVSSLVPLPIIATMTKSFRDMSGQSCLAWIWLRFMWLWVLCVALGGFYAALIWGMTIASIGGSEAATAWLVTCITGVAMSVFVSSCVVLLVKNALLPSIVKYMGRNSKTKSMSKKNRCCIKCLSTVSSALSAGMMEDGVAEEDAEQQRNVKQAADEGGWASLRSAIRTRMVGMSFKRSEVTECKICADVMGKPGFFRFPN